MEHKVYELYTISDIFEKIPLDRIPVFLDEMKELAKSRQKLRDEIELKGTIQKFHTNALLWKDDGNPSGQHKVTIEKPAW